MTIFPIAGNDQSAYVSGGLNRQASGLYGGNAIDLSSLLNNRAYGATGERQQGVSLSASYDYFMQNYVVKLKQGAADLKAAMADLSKGAFSSYVPRSGDEKALRAYARGAPSGGADKRVTIERIATGQVNEGVSAKGDAASALAEGYHQIEIEVAGKRHQVSFEIARGEGNRSVQQTIAQAINRRDIGVSASVTESGSLVLSAKATGEVDEARFSVRDVLGAAASTLALDNTIQQAGDALYRVDGGEQRRSATNEVDLGGGVWGELKKEGSATVSVEKDGSKAALGAKAMVAAYNSLLTITDQDSGIATSAGGARLRRDLTGIAKTYSASLGGVGIQVKADGSLSIDEDKLGAAAQNGALERLFSNGGVNYGFAGRLSALSAGISRSPMKYVNDVFPNIHYNANMGLLLNLTI